MTTAKSLSIQERSRIYASVLQDLMKRGVLQACGGDALSPMMKVKLATVLWVMNRTVFSSVGWVFTFMKKLQFQF
jgi:hypothetical protein